ncbi:hypothetical protein ACOMHN_063281 [Nucella lapillus]
MLLYFEGPPLPAVLSMCRAGRNTCAEHGCVAVGALEVEHKEVDDATVREAEHKEVDDATVREAEHKEVDDATVREAEHKEVDDATVREAEHKEVDDATVREAEHKEVDDATVREAEHKEVDDATVREAEHKEVDDATVREAEHKEVDDATVREAEHKEVDDATVRDGFFDEVAVGSEDLAGDEDVMFDHDSELSDTWSVDLPQEYGDQGAGMSDEQGKYFIGFIKQRIEIEGRDETSMKGELSAILHCLGKLATPLDIVKIFQFREKSAAQQGILADTMLHSVAVHNECYAAATKRSTRLVGLKFSGAVALLRGTQQPTCSGDPDQPSCSGDSSQVNMPASEDDDGPIPPPTRPPSPALVEEFQELPTLKAGVGYAHECFPVSGCSRTPSPSAGLREWTTTVQTTSVGAATGYAALLRGAPSSSSSLHVSGRKRFRRQKKTRLIEINKEVDRK